MSAYFPSAEECGRHTIFPGVNIRTCAGEKMTISVASLAAGSVVEEHAHVHEQMGMVLEGRLIFHIGDEQRTLGPGDLFRIPSNVRHKVITLDQPAKVIDVFCPVREEYR